MTARRTLLVALVGFPLWLLSYAWVPFELNRWPEPAWLFLVIFIGELGALAVGLLTLVAGIRLVSKLPSGSRQWRQAAWARALGGLLVLLVIGLNVLAQLFLN